MMMTAVLAPAAAGNERSAMRGDAHLTTTKVPDASVDLERFRSLMQENGLSHELVPNAPSDIRTFQRVCGGLQTKRGGKDQRGTYVDSVRIVSDSHECVYMITQGVKDPGNRDLEHHNAMRVVFDKDMAAAGSDPIAIEVVNGAKFDELNELIERLRLEYKLLRGKLPGSKVRGIYREEFRRMNATRWSRTGSVWFVPAEHGDRLERMERVLRALYADDCEFDTLEVIADEAKLRDKAGQHAKGEATQLLEEMSGLLAADKVRAGSKQRVLERRQQLIDYRDRMKAELNGDVDTIEGALRLLDRNVLALMSKKES
jgi:hypothetical protein